jgi:hypothetical protein
MIDPGLPVLIFAILGVAAGLSRGRPNGRRFVNAFIAYTLALSFAAGFTQHEVWPFSAWPLVAGRAPSTITQPRIVAVDTDGVEHEIDHRAWGPLVFQELNGWHDKHFFRLDPAARERAAAYLLGVVEGNRKRWAAGNPEPYWTRYLGPLSAPLFLGHPSHWDASVPQKPFVGLRHYRETWDVEERLRDPKRVTRVLRYEFRTP